MDNAKKLLMEEAIKLAYDNLNNTINGPFGAIIVKDNIIVGRGANSVASTNDPTAHAEVNAIRDACKNLNTFDLDNCDIYTSCEPCPMCLGAIYWAHLNNIYYAEQDGARHPEDGGAGPGDQRGLPGAGHRRRADQPRHPAVGPGDPAKRLGLRGDVFHRGRALQPGRAVAGHHRLFRPCR